MSKDVAPGIHEIIAFMFVWLLFTSVTYGIWVPAGLFLPGIIIGCSLGLLYDSVVQSIFPGVMEQ